ncbi:glycoside hydrolase family 3 N-terminal domain-containing protein [Christensenella intestinihominis]|uniref:glycoside hydrolase family 3 N-terminal domain-containing protein n=1 Tax=Christensenella intestinihominis TaxID=1851429 RepID=UPI0009F556EA|nr:glycoside hydrolase family 3 N-terminal domain-containing protein [Christensenella intestinihominis]
MKKTITAVFLCGLFIMAGCAVQEAEETAAPTVVSAPVDSVSGPSPSPEPQEPETKTAAGTVLAADDTGFSLENDNGARQSFSFSGEDSGVPLVRTVKPGDTVRVTYMESGAKPIVRDVEVTQDAPNPPFNLYAGRAEEILQGMTTEEKVGQMFFARCPEGDAAAVAEEYQPAGYILFDRDFKGKSRDEVIGSIESCQQVSRLGMLIGVDEEGGTVNRVSKYEELCSDPFLSPQELYSEGGMERIVSDTAGKAEVLKGLGINVNLAPVCDVSVNPDDFIYKRAFGKDAEETAGYVTAVVRQMNESGIGCTLKHFPGYGSNTDTHTGIAHDTRDYGSFLESDFLPFAAGIEENAGSILVCHNIVECIDGEYPASLSEKAHDILRSDLGFSGVIMTDDLYMDAIRDEYGVGEAAVLAVRAGNDLILSSQFEEQYQAVLDALGDGSISGERIDEAAGRVLCWKLSLGVIE